MRVLEGHILKPLKRQVEQTGAEQPDVSRALQGSVAATERHIARLEARLRSDRICEGERGDMRVAEPASSVRSSSNHPHSPTLSSPPVRRRPPKEGGACGFDEGV
jgi:hypothetical protein